MKRLYLVLIGVLFIILAIVVLYKTVKPVSVTVSFIRHIPSPTVSVPNNPNIRVGNETYTYSYIAVATASAISLIPNFTEKTDSQTLIETNKCTAAINGGFYNRANKPLGFFYSRHHAYGTKISSNLINGYFWTDDRDMGIISSELPQFVPYRFVVQTGPILFFNGQMMQLAIKNDENARRMVVAKTSDNRYLFITVYSADSVFSGPLLSDLPAAVSEISAITHLQIVDALNLDGGSASAFYSGDLHLSELTPVGSMFCIQNY